MIRPTGTHCRDIALEMRDMAEEQARCGQPLSEFLSDVLGLGYEQDIEAREADVISELAWLIDRPTTHVGINKHGRAYCEDCGCDDWCLADGAKFCPNCGAEVSR